MRRNDPRRRTRRCPPLPIALLLPALLIAGNAAAGILFIGFEQHAYQDNLTLDTTPPSDIGACVVEFQADPAPGYLNVAGWIPGLSPEPQWIVRNLYLHDLAGGEPQETITCAFPLAMLGVESGVACPPILYGWTVQADVLLDADAAAWLASVPLAQSAPVAQALIQVGYGVESRTAVFDGGDSGVWFSVHATPGADSTFCNIGCTMPNLDLAGATDPMDVNACFPTACSNSLHWLKGVAGQTFDIPDNPRETMKQLGRLAQRTAPVGVWPNAMAKAKLDYIEAHRLPIEVKVQDISSAGNITSSSGLTTATDKDAGPNQWPTRDHLMKEARDGEDVEVCVTWYYVDDDGKLKPSNYSHALVLTGAGTKAGKDYIKLKDDTDQGAAGGLKQRTSGVRTEAGTLRLPKLSITIPAGPGAGKKGIPLVSSVVSESYKADVPHPPATEPFNSYCQYIKRTIPAGATVTYTFPDTGSTRCFNVTLTTRDPYDGHDMRRGPWNFNKGGTRSWTNTRPNPVVVMLHNDDKSGGTPYAPWNVTTTVTPASGKQRADDPFNPEDFGGFSLGGTDGSSEEFGSGLPPGAHMVGPVDNEFDLSAFPAQLSATGVFRVDLNATVHQWNVYWGHLGLVVDVLNVAAPGDLYVECPASGVVALLPIAAPGRYELDLGPQAGGLPVWHLALEARNGLDIELDALGVPSLVPVATGVAPLPAAPRIRVEAWPNPFNPSLELRVTLPRESETLVTIHDLRGLLLKTLHQGPLAAASHGFAWDGRDAHGRDVPAGTYLLRVEQAGAATARKVALVR